MNIYRRNIAKKSWVTIRQLLLCLTFLWFLEHLLESYNRAYLYVFNSDLVNVRHSDCLSNSFHLGEISRVLIPYHIVEEFWYLLGTCHSVYYLKLGVPVALYVSKL